MLKINSGIFSRIFWGLAILIAAAVSLLPPPGHVPVLMYHFIGTADEASRSKNYVDLKSFERQMSFLKNLAYRVISLDELYAIRTGKTKPRGREIVITFDDANYGFETEALPVLRRYNFPVTQFAVSEHVAGTINAGSMNAEKLRALTAENPQFSVQSHTRTHAVLTELTPEKLREEVLGSKQELEQMLGRPVEYLSYPAGIFNAETAQAAREAGYRMAFTTSPKKLAAAGGSADLFAVTRVKITRSSDNLISFWVQISGIYEWFKQTRQQWKQRLAKN